jgi:transaldolase
MSKLHDLHRAGQSVWLDFIRRDHLENGDLAGLVGDGVRGLTSNPTIFQKALAASAEYDDQVQEMLAGEVGDTAKAFLQIAIRDIKAAADALTGIYEASGGQDGLVSLEVSPFLADDTEGTVADARRLWKLVDRPNLMIKVPATPAGIPAIEELIADNINVNATLMFSLDHYEAVANAYIRGAERASQPDRLASVASFFVSRVDTSTDAALEKVGSDEALALRGTIAVANAKLAYRRYRELFEGDAFATAGGRGAHPQRVLWASTSTKNPEYNDVLYVEELIGSNTVNTMPPATIAAFVDHGDVLEGSLTSDVDRAEAAVTSLAGMGIDFDDITETLQVDGVASFAASYEDLLATLGDKIRVMSA